MSKAQLTFADVNITVTVPMGTRIIKISEKAGSGIAYGCRENDCGDCLIVVTAGMENLSIPSSLEQHLLKQKNAQPFHRLACQTAVLGDATIKPA